MVQKPRKTEQQFKLKLLINIESANLTKLKTNKMAQQNKNGFHNMEAITL